MEYIYEYGLFLAQAVTFVAAIVLVAASLVAIGQRQKAEQHEGHIEVRDLNEKYRQIGDSIQHIVVEPDELKALKKARKKPTNSSLSRPGKSPASPRTAPRSAASGCTCSTSRAT